MKKYYLAGCLLLTLISCILIYQVIHFKAEVVDYHKALLNNQHELLDNLERDIEQATSALRKESENRPSVVFKYLPKVEALNIKFDLIQKKLSKANIKECKLLERSASDYLDSFFASIRMRSPLANAIFSDHSYDDDSIQNLYTRIELANAQSRVLWELIRSLPWESNCRSKQAMVYSDCPVVKTGAKYRAFIYLGDYDPNFIPNIQVDNKPVLVKNGQGIYEVSTNQPGFHTFSGDIIVEIAATGDIKKYHFQQKYFVVQ